MQVSRVARTAMGGILVGAVLGLSGPALPSEAAKTYTKAKVIRVVDGDTIKVDYDGNGRWDHAIRLIGIDTPEHDRCGFTAATRALKSLVRHKVVTLRSDTGRIGAQSRPERRVLVPVGGKMVDATTWLLERGLGVWMPRKGETTNSWAHHRAAASAAARGVGWFNEDRCGAGPGAEGSLSMQAEYKADAAHKLSVGERRNQEFLRIRNNGIAPVSIDRWTLRIGNDRREFVPSGGAIPAGETLTVHIGYGTNTLLHRYIGSSDPMLVDADIDGRSPAGGGSYLVDPNGDIRAHTTWPCAGACPDPTGGALVISNAVVDPPGSEWQSLNSEVITLTNTGNVPIRTGDFVVEVSYWVYELPPDHVLQPGESVDIKAGKGDDSRLTRYLDAKYPPLDNDSGRVILRSYDSIVVDCLGWGSATCPRS